ncbi:MAG: RsmB/NOP family class I SAM-dependent RNA methyltransferase [Crenarchaeota archaeon]|nr:RsmB/NOP family class I SAM-dependent RNA methyltransferase [Thermoproteota archaeon]
MSLSIEDIINFVSKVLHKILTSEISIDKAFQCVKSSWKDRESFKIYYDITFQVVKNYFRLRYLSKNIFGTETCKDIVRTWLILHGEEYFHRRDIVKSYVRRLLRRRGLRNRDLSKLANDLVESLRKIDPIEYLSVKYSYPRPVIEILLNVIQFEDLERMLSKMNRPTMWLRVNTLKVDVDKCIKMLEKDNILVEQDRDVPFLLKVVEARRPVHHADTIRKMYAIPQDKASVLTVLELSPEKNDIVYDVCAAPGMKSSLIMQLTENRCKLTLVDISRDRTANMLRVLKRAGVDLSNVNILIADSRNLKIRIRGECKVLIDAPCSSSGAAGKDPAVRIALRELRRLPWYVDIQKSIIMNIIEQAKEIEIVYSTCSLLPQEGEEIIEHVSGKRDIELKRPRTRLAEGYLKYSVGKTVGRTLPHIHDCEGFFISRFVV